MNTNTANARKISQGELEQRGVAKQPVDGDVFAKSLPPDHEPPGPGFGRLSREWPDCNQLVQWVSEHNLPMVEDRHTNCLIPGDRALFSLEAEGANGLDEGSVGVDYDERIVRDVTSPPGQDDANRKDAALSDGCTSHRRGRVGHRRLIVNAARA